MTSTEHQKDQPGGASVGQAGRLWQVGELAQAAGITVRTLHHWDELALVSPSQRAANGYRLYDADDVRRLYQVLAFKRLGLPLAEIADAIDGAGDLAQLLRQQLAAIDANLAETAALRDRLAAVLAQAEGGAQPGPDELLELMEHMAMVEQYYTPEQQEALAQRAADLGEEGMAKAQQDWADLMAEAEAERLKGTDPSAPQVAALAQRWHALIQAFAGGDQGTRENLQRMYDEEGPEVASRGMVNMELMAYMGQALQAAGLA